MEEKERTLREALANLGRELDVPEDAVPEFVDDCMELINKYKN